MVLGSFTRAHHQQVERASGELSFITPGADVKLRPGQAVKAFIGSDDFHLVHYQDGTLTDISGKVLRQHVLHCSMSNNSQILLVDGMHLEVLLLPR